MSQNTTRRSRLAFSLTLLMALSGQLVNESRADSGAPSHRSEQQILADLDATSIPNYQFGDQIEPKYREQMNRELSGPLQKRVELFSQLGKASPRYAETSREEVWLYEAQLAFLGHDDVLKELTDESESKVPSEALAGKAGLLVVNWWGVSDEDKQKQELTQFEDLAKSNPKDDLLVAALLNVARYRAASDEVASAARDIVEKDLKGPAAIKYKTLPAKLGRHFMLSGYSVDQKPVSIAAWHGKVVVIDFWATWCGPCRQSMPELIKLYQENHDKGLEVLGVSNDSDLSALRQYLAGNKDMAWPQLYGPNPPNGWNRIAQDMDVDEIPTEFYIDRNGVLRDIEVNNLRQDLVAQLLAETVKPAGASPNKADAHAPAVSVTETTSDSDITAKPAVPSADDQANSLLSKAKLLIANGRPELATTALNNLIATYPQSAAADKAKALLSQLNNGQ